jgi:hypothetical protein
MKKAVLLPVCIILLMMAVILPAAGADNTTTQAITSEQTPVTTAPNITAGPVITEKPEATPGSTESPDTTIEPQLTKEEAIFWATLGIFTSFIIPVLKRYAVQVAAKLRKTPNADVDQWQEIWKAISPYVATTLLSLFVAVVIVASLYSAKTPMPGWYVPFLAGYAWDSTIQKIKPGKDDPA